MAASFGYYLRYQLIWEKLVIFYIFLYFINYSFLCNLLLTLIIFIFFHWTKGFLSSSYFDSFDIENLTNWNMPNKNSIDKKNIAITPT